MGRNFALFPEFVAEVGHPDNDNHGGVHDSRGE